MILTTRINTIIKLFFREERKFYFFIHQIAGYWPKNIELFREAVTHKSANKRRHGKPFNNERLEYLGDAVLDMVTADVLYHKCKDADEGFLSRVRGEIVSRKELNRISIEMGLSDRILYSGALAKTQTHLPGDALEAVVAAIYLDGGMRRARKFIDKYIVSDQSLLQAAEDKVDYKSQLVQWGQKNRVVVLFSDKEYDRNSDNQIVFGSVVWVDGENLGEGEGTSKKMAEQRASKMALDMLNSASK